MNYPSVPNSPAVLSTGAASLDKSDTSIIYGHMDM